MSGQRAAFPTGVCDWSKPGVDQQPTIPWMTYQNAMGGVVTGGVPLGSPPQSTPCDRAAHGWKAGSQNAC
ncbi:MAG: DUF6351 family protein [Actinomycetota bacterium]